MLLWLMNMGFAGGGVAAATGGGGVILEELRVPYLTANNRARRLRDDEDVSMIAALIISEDL